MPDSSSAFKQTHAILRKALFCLGELTITAPQPKAVTFTRKNTDSGNIFIGYTRGTVKELIVTSPCSTKSV